ncbi:terpenoid synthase [Daedaleopsis nitida]|nr:terpenoid synthase [Daedaleopsis nitida]
MPCGSSSPSFALPDLLSDCPYPLRCNAHCEAVARASEAWMLADANFSPRRRDAFLGLLAGELAAACYPDTDAPRLRVAADFLNFLFTLDDWSDEFSAEDTYGLAECVMRALWDPEGFATDKAAGRLAKSFFSRFRQDAGPRCTRRFVDTMGLFFQAITQQARDRARGDIPSFEEYVALRWDTSGCKPCFALIEYAAGMDLPDEVAYHPVIQNLENAANACISWSNDLFSYNTEQARGDTHNTIAILMHHHHLGLQEAVDYLGGLCKLSIERFEQERRRLPSWGAEVDRDVATYVLGLEDWMVGTLHWSFDSTRYFGGAGAAIKRHGVVALLPRKPSPSS